MTNTEQAQWYLQWVFVSLYFVRFFLKLYRLLCIYWGFWFCAYGIFMCTNMHVSASAFLLLFLWLFCFYLFHPSLVFFLLYFVLWWWRWWYLFFPKDRQSVHLGGKGDGGDLGGIGKREVVIRIYCMKKPVSNKRKKKEWEKAKQTKHTTPQSHKLAVERLISHIIFLDLIFISFLYEVCSVFTSWPRLKHTSWIWAVSCNKNAPRLSRLAYLFSEVPWVVKIPVSQQGSLDMLCGLVALRRSSLRLSS